MMARIFLHRGTENFVSVRCGPYAKLEVVMEGEQDDCLDHCFLYATVPLW